MATNVWHLHETAPAPQPTVAAGERRRAQRRPLAVERASVWDAHGDAADEARLLDLSIYGCRLKVVDAPDEGDRLWLRFDGGWPVAASVVWADGDRIGCRFDEAIPGAMMRELSRALI
jgi:hypothetical protein